VSIREKQAGMKKTELWKKRMEKRKDRKSRTIREDKGGLSRREGRQQGRNEKQTKFWTYFIYQL